MNSDCPLKNNESINNPINRGNNNKQSEISASANQKNLAGGNYKEWKRQLENMA